MRRRRGSEREGETERALSAVFGVMRTGCEVASGCVNLEDHSIHLTIHLIQHSCFNSSVNDFMMRVSKWKVHFSVGL